MSSKTTDPIQYKVQVWLLNPAKNKVLLFKTAPREKLGSFWQPVTGKVEPGEDLDPAALREVKEETGMDLVQNPTRLGYEFEYPSRWGGLAKEVTYWALAPEVPPVLDPKEHTAARWVLLDEASTLLTFESYREALKRLTHS